MKKSYIFLFTIGMLPYLNVSANTLSQRLAGDYFIVTPKTDVSIIINDIAANYSLPVFISPKITDSFLGELKADNALIILDKLAKMYHLSLYYDENILYVYKSDEITRSIITPNYLDTNTLISYLKKPTQNNNASCQIKKISSFNSLEVRGVPECIKYITNLASNLDKESQTKATNKDVIRVFKLKYASAVDINYKYRDQSVTVPGVISILKTMANDGTLPSQGNNATDSSKLLSGGQAQISADPRQNAIIVKDREITMDIYQQLITHLDVEQRQIEISVSIIDVDANDLQQLGVNWSGSMSFGNSSVSFNSQNTSATLSTAVISNANNFLIRVNALQQNSKAKILSQPSVITLNNMQAILDKNVTFFTKVSSERSASLESITSGTLLRVTPRIINSQNNSDVLKNEKVRLLLDIQDGSQSPSTQNNQEALPQVQNSEITTEATLNAGESLLLGGFIQDREISGKAGIPLLRDIPLIGHLFSSSTQEKHSVMRLFLIKATPINN
ncbi:EscC/YscC/HrcC family type III secretion system outer membrane ring protein [Edwardsiella anguillarum]|uniref:EscC/YscC/HrcC family type III secretion system outer membrane ring protein n=1 Tax=Edwardsiella anguillarum TaxID=1821960 RepID=UPI0024B7763B|nr:EscC/YscC/HrcC family type III secretion system outer membrane ring protein [Edwardsiella anguillarum]WHQ14441.1 EscC/YscC/HrcC family type III secretion system outer membrane ring protein [Edwardsiella anguillarum]